MKKYLHELKNVTWPENKEVTSQFIIVVIGIIFLICFFILSDTIVSSFVEKLYT